MNVLVVGSGGREHALCWKIKQSPLVRKLICAPGNAGILKVATCVDVKANDIESLIRLARAEEIDLTVVGPEAPLSLGIADKFEEAKLRVFGPSHAASKIESSKVFAKNLFKKYNIPTAFYATFDDYKEALKWVDEVKPPLVVKVDGLAEGKGVFICKDVDTAADTLDSILNGKMFGDAGERVVIEEYLEGEEASFFAFSDGDNLLPLASSQDHKQLLDGDEGPNTGGMGAYSPAPLVTPELYKTIMDEVMLPTVKALKAEGMSYKGILYAGLMISGDDVKVLEFNCRFGDPEAQPLLMRMNSDIVPILNAVVDGDLSGCDIQWREESAVCVVMASKGYPGDYKKGVEIPGINNAEGIDNVAVFHAGTALKHNKIVTSGGRVLGVTALGRTIPESIQLAYTAVKAIDSDTLHYRTDIGSKALKYIKT
ncbi:MAG: phosphoribosylamine--glycine ligase [Thermodesulfobacteriota bacterium]